jgi:MoxR-like ATPase
MVNLDYPSFEQEMAIVKSTTSNVKTIVNKVLGAEEIIVFQDLVRKVPVADNVVEYAVRLVHKTRQNIEGASEESKKFLEWGAGPRASQNLVLAAKCHALINGKYSPDIEDVKAVAFPVLRHRIVRNFKAEAEGMSTEEIIKKLM